jgi:hypothetical protein
MTTIHPTRDEVLVALADAVPSGRAVLSATEIDRLRAG